METDGQDQGSSLTGHVAGTPTPERGAGAEGGAGPEGGAGAEPWFPTGRAPWLVIAVGVGLRLAWATVGARAPRILADPGIYQQAALRIAHGYGYVSFNRHPTAYYPPGYPWFLGSFQWLLERVGAGSHTVGATAVLQSLLSGVAIAAVMVVGQRLDGRKIAIAAGSLLALWPNLIVHASLMLSETLFITLLSVSLAATVTMVDREGRLLPTRAVAAGAFLGAATLVRPQVLLVAAAVVLAWSLSRIGARDVLRRTAVLGVGVVVVVAPWTIRNAVVFGAFIPVSTNDGDNLCVGYNPEATGYFTMPESCNTGELYTAGPAAELRRQAETRDRALRFIRQHPGDLPELTWKKLWYTYRSDNDGIWASMSFGRDPWLRGWGRRVVDVVSTVYYAAVMLLAVAGGVLGIRSWWLKRRSTPNGPLDPTTLVVVAGAVASSVVPALFFGDPRFKVGATPFYAVLAAVAATALVDRLRVSRRPASAPPDAAAPDPATLRPGPSTPS